MKQTIVIQVAMTCDKCRSKALSLVAATGGVDSVKLAGDTKDQVVVEGEVDAIKLTCTLRKKVGPSTLIEVVDTAKKKKEEEEKKKKEAEEKKKKEAEEAAALCSSYYRCPPYNPYVAGYCCEEPNYACTIM